MSINNVLVVYKKSVYELYSNSPDKELREFMAESNRDVERMKKSHEAQQKSLETIVAGLSRAGISHEAIYRAELETMGVGGSDLVISVGGDGTFLEVSHYILSPELPILGVNSDTNASTGFFTYATADNFAKVMEAIENGKAPITVLNRLEVILNDKKLPEPVLNDILVAHTNPAAMTRYTLVADRVPTEVRSSGLLVCTAAGSTGWIYQEGGVVMPLSSTEMQYFSRGVRGEKPQLAGQLEVQSHTRQGRAYLDGAHLTYDFTIGSVIKLIKGPQLTVIGNLEEKRAAYAAESLMK